MNEKNKKNSKSDIKDSDVTQEIKVIKDADIIETDTNESGSKLTKNNSVNPKNQNVEVEKKDIKIEDTGNKVVSQVDEKNKVTDKKAELENKRSSKTSSNKSQNKSSKQKTSNVDNKSGSNKNFSDENEYIEKLVSINRVAKVVKGGRRFSFAALVVVGDGNGMVGHGKGKAKEVPEAIKKATDEAKTRLIRVPLRQARTLHHDITGRYDAGKVTLRSAPSGTGVIAGGPMRAVFEALGIKDIVAKSVGSSNPHNMIRATFDALSSASSPKLISIRRGLKVNEITKRRKGATVAMENSDA